MTDLATDLRLGAMATAIAAIVAWAGWTKPLPRAPETAPPHSSEWKTVEWQPAELGSDLRSLKQRNIWGGQRATAPAAPTPQQTGPWRVTGTVDWGDGLSAIVQVQPPGASRPQFVYRKAGDALPDGRVITSVEPGLLRLTDGRSESQFRLFLPAR
jgi:hypothetical protein